MKHYTNVTPAVPCTSEKIKCDACGIALLSKPMRAAWDTQKQKNYHCLECAAKIEDSLLKPAPSIADAIPLLERIANALEAKQSPSSSVDLFKTKSATEVALADQNTLRIAALEQTMKSTNRTIDYLAKELKDLKGE